MWWLSAGSPSAQDGRYNCGRCLIVKKSRCQLCVHCTCTRVRRMSKRPKKHDTIVDGVWSWGSHDANCVHVHLSAGCPNCVMYACLQNVQAPKDGQHNCGACFITCTLDEFEALAPPDKPVQLNYRWINSTGFYDRISTDLVYRAMLLMLMQARPRGGGNFTGELFFIEKLHPPPHKSGWLRACNVHRKPRHFNIHVYRWNSMISAVMFDENHNYNWLLIHSNIRYVYLPKPKL